jgi:hypothetical protein
MGNGQVKVDWDQVEVNPDILYEMMVASRNIHLSPHFSALQKRYYYKSLVHYMQKFVDGMG